MVTSIDILHKHTNPITKESEITMTNEPTYNLALPSANHTLLVDIRKTLPDLFDDLAAVYDDIFSGSLGGEFLDYIDQLMLGARRHRVYRSDLLRGYNTFYNLAKNAGVEEKYIFVLWNTYTKSIFKQAPEHHWAHDKPMTVILKEMKLNRENANVQ